MADSKRNSVGGRVATPKLPQGPGDLGTWLSKAIGARVKLTIASPPLTVEGTIYTADPITNLIAINTAPNASPLASTPGDYHLIPVSRIQSFTILALDQRVSNAAATGDSEADSGYTPTFSNALPAINRLDLRALKAREDAAIRKIKEADANRGKGVSKEAQALFDGIRRLLPARWHEKSIIVNDNVIIAPPYTLESCSASKGGENSLKQVKKVLEATRARQGKSSAAGSSASGSAATGNTGTSTPTSKSGTPPVALPAVPLKKGG